jgi:polyisoprenoid-binding protein YceI
MLRIFFLSLLFCSGLWAREPDNLWLVNPDHSEFFFKVPYLGVSEVTGSFQRLRGKVMFDQDLQLAQDILISLDPNSINSGNTIRDGHLRSADFLNSTVHKAILFRSSDIKATAPGLFQASGYLTIKGVKAPLTISYSLSDSVTDTWGNENKFVKFQGQLNRRDFGLEWNKKIANSELLVGNEIQFYGTFQLQPIKKITPSHNYMLPNTRYIQERERLRRGEITQQQFDSLFESFEEKVQAQIQEQDQQLQADSKALAQPTPEASVTPDTWPAEVAPPPQRDWRWWLAYGIVALFGMTGMILFFIQAKHFVSERYKSSYEEVGRLGNLTDFLIYPLGFVFLIALWHLGVNS